MNFKLKALVAALALAVTLPASATMTNTVSGDSSMILTLLDTTAGISATFDLGVSKSTFNQSVDNSFNVTTGDYATAWNSFWASATVGNTQYAVFAGDALGTATGSQSIFTTVSSSSITNVSNAILTTQQGNFDKYIAAHNNIENHISVTNGGSVSIASANNDYAGVTNAYGTAGKIGNYGSDTNALIGTDMNVYNISKSSTNSLTNATATKLIVSGFNPYFNLSSTGVLNYTAVAAVPEADTSAMMMVGLGLMGFIARRRRNGNAA